MLFREDTGTGYMYCYNPNHYCANKAGKVLEHVYVMAESIKRPLQQGECVHHKDRNRKNNKLENLQLMTLSEHAALHMFEDKGVVYEEVKCVHCSKPFMKTNFSQQKCCSALCAKASLQRFDVSKEELEYLVWAMPTTHVAERLGVSDVAVAKRCKKFGIEKPGRGYWAKLYSYSDENKIHSIGDLSSILSGDANL